MSHAPKIVSHAEWLKARKALLQKEKELTRQRDALNRERLNLPWELVEKSYAFDAPDGTKTLAELFGPNKQLLIYHFMFGPDWQEGCPSCSLVADHFDGSIVHLAQRDVTLLVVSRAPLEKIEAFKRRMGWRFAWVSSLRSDFNYDFAVSFTPEQRQEHKPLYNYGSVEFPADEAPGVSAFFKAERGTVFHTYSTFARGAEPLLGVYDFLDIAPKGRDEAGQPWPMAWVKHHDRYGA